MQEANSSLGNSTQGPSLERRLNLLDSAAIVVGCIIGTGVFLKTTVMAQQCGSMFLVLCAWFVAGLLSVAGALTYAELGSLYGEAGGEYIYLKKSYPGLWGYLYGWMRFFIASPGSIASYAVGAATFLSSVINVELFGGQKYFAVFLIIIFSLINCLNVVVGGKLQTLMTILKVGIIGFVIGGVFTSGTQPHLIGANDPNIIPSWSSFGAAVLAALWAFDGWNNLPMIAGEVKNPERNIPLSLLLGVGVVFVIYSLVNVAYFYAVPFAEVLTASSSQYRDALPVATKAVQTFLGPAGITFISIGMFFSAVGGMNGSILTSARVPYAMAHEGQFFKVLAKVHPKTHVPVVSVLVQMGISVILALSGSFDQLTDYVVFSSWLFYALTAAAIFVTRKKETYTRMHYKMFGYPIIPIVFIALAGLLVVNTFYVNPISSLIGVGIIASGIPFYFILHRRNE